MPRKAITIAAAALALAALGSGASSAWADSGDVLVRFEAGADAGDRARARDEAGARFEEGLPLRGLQLVDPEPGVSAAEATEDLERSPDVLYAEPDRPRSLNATANDTYFGLEWGLRNTGQSVAGTSGTPDADIDADEAWDITTGNSGIAIGVVDSGVDYNHPDLQSNIWTNAGESGSGRESNGADDDGNGLVDDWRGWDWVQDDNTPMDENGHGTHVSGTAGGRGNDGTGVAGVAWQSRIVPLRVLDADGSGFVSDVISGYGYARQKGIEIVNASLGGDSFSQAERDALAAAPNTLFVVAAGNDGANNDVTGSFPCNYSLPNILCVAATDQNDQLADFSNFGAGTVDLAAPGVNIASSYPGGQWVYMDGTSMATPHAAGAAALVWSLDQSAPAVGVRQTLIASIDAKPSLAGLTVTAGRLNVARALGLNPSQIEVPGLGSGSGSPPPAPSSPPSSSSPAGSGSSSPSRPRSVARRDSTAPGISLRVARRQQLGRALRRGLSVSVRCSEACRFRVELRGRPGLLARATGRMSAARSRTVRLRFTRQAKGRLRARRAVRARLRIRAVDASRNGRTAARSLMLAR